MAQTLCRQRLAESVVSGVPLALITEQSSETELSPRGARAIPSGDGGRQLTQDGLKEKFKMKKKEARTLKLSKETLRALNEDGLGGVNGGQTGTLCSGYTDACASHWRCPSVPCGSAGC